MTTEKLIRKEVLDVIKRMVKPGMPVTRTVWKAAYGIVRQRAIDETIIWKQRNITIERT